MIVRPQNERGLTKRERTERQKALMARSLSILGAAFLGNRGKARQLHSRDLSLGQARAPKEFVLRSLICTGKNCLELER
jgi:hypothetical protein